MTDINQSHFSIQNLIDLVANTLDAFTTVLFLAPDENSDLVLSSYQTLSRNVLTDSRIRPGEGLIGWVYKNQKPVYVDQFDHDTRQLMFYKTDEAIKSFMAIPLPKVRGVLAVDSKQRYVFTEKSQKILHQFGQCIEITLELIGRTNQCQSQKTVLDFISSLDNLLDQRLYVDQTVEHVLANISKFTEASAAYLTAVFPGEPETYYIVGHDGQSDPKVGTRPLDITSGLAGWVLQNRKSLIHEKIRSGAERSFIFHPDEPLKRYTSFAGFPLFRGGKLLGALLIIGDEPLGLGDIKTEGLELACQRLASALEIELLFQRIAEQGRLDTQLAMPHRTYFAKRLTRMLKLASVQNSGVTLWLIRLMNLESVAVEVGQDAAQEILKEAARYLLVYSPPETELGHLTYGVIGLAINSPIRDSVREILKGLAGHLSDRPLKSAPDRIQIDVQWTAADSSNEVRTAEEMIFRGLSRLMAAESSSTAD